MAAKAGGSKSGRSRSGSSKKKAASAKRPASKRSSSRRSTPKRSTGSRRAPRAATSSRSDKSVQQFRDALERSVVVPRERIQEVLDDAVKRGRMTRSDANEMISKLVSRGRKQTDAMLRDLERLLDQARREVGGRTAGARRDLETRTTRARRSATQTAGRVSRVARDAADRPLAEADRLRRRAGGPGFPITAYDQLTANQVKTRLRDLNKADLRKVRTREKNGESRKGVLDAIEKRLA
jgi:polyhydroxyalkanoate synthesis regulator phasin